jgi:serine protease Do
MSTKTNSLVAKLTGWILPAAVVAVLAFSAIFLLGHNVAQAATRSAESPLSANEIAPLVTVDNAVEAVVHHVMPAVVDIEVTATVNQDQNASQGFGGINPNEIPPEFRHFFFFGPGNGQNQKPQYQEAIGSGFIISPDGYIVTNHHVVAGAKTIEVTLHNRQVYAAKVVGVDKLDDLAVIKINATNLPTVSWGDSAKLEDGEAVMAFGNPFGELSFSVTRGIVSATHRGVSPSNNLRAPKDYIQTDAAINPGNSGGPLVDAYGRVIGINTFIYSNSGSFAGAGFAIPSDLAQHYVNEIIKTGKVEHGFLGIDITNITPQNAKFFDLPAASGALVDQVSPDTPASRAGFQRGDVIRSINGKGITDATDLQVMVSEMAPGTAINLGILRNGKPLTLKATVGQYHGNGEEAQNSGAGSSQHARLGITPSDLTSGVRQQLNVPASVHGVVVEHVASGSPADLAGLQSGDVIMEVDRHPVDSVDSFMSEVQSIPAGQDVLLLVWSNQGTAYVVLQTNQAGQ